MSMLDVATKFFEACETGKGWDGCKAYCTPDAAFSAQSEPLAKITTLAAYADWMKATLKPLPDGRYDLKAFAADEARSSVVAYAVFNATHTAEGGPKPPTGRSMSTDYVYVMRFDGDRISQMTKIWNSGWALKQVGWA
ncbi:MAG: nuclear transport factor 2 family protein [Proteobacteria bacterium]|nr:nuclear transport factor 2 family protein [Pseudomonadota bacterium]